MQEKLTIARPYAAAAFDYAAEHGQIEGWSAMLAVLAAAVSEPSLARLIGHPKISDGQMLEVLVGVLGERLDQARRNYLQVLLEAERLDVAPQIAELFERRRADAAGVVNVLVTSAFALDADEQSKIAAAVQARLGRTSTVEASVDQALIGGAVIKIGDSVIDLSLRGRLSGLSQLIS